MSWQACAWAQDAGPAYQLKPLTRLVLLTLANYGDKEGHDIFPSIETLQRDTGLSRGAVRSHIKLLIAAGCLQETGRVAVNRPGNHATNCYRLRMDKPLPIPEAAPEPVDNDPQEDEIRGSSRDPLPNQGVKRRRSGGHMTTFRGSPRDPNPLKNLKEPRARDAAPGRGHCGACGKDQPVVNLEDGMCPDCLAARPTAPPVDVATGVAYFRQLRAQALPE